MNAVQFVGIIMAAIIIAVGMTAAACIAAEVIRETRCSPTAEEIYKNTIRERDATVKALRTAVHSKDSLIRELTWQLERERRKNAGTGSGT